MSSTSVVATVGNPDSNPQGARHRRLQTPVVAATGPTASTPRGPAIDVFKLRWWPLLEIPTATLRGAAINIFNIGGGRCQPCRQHPPGGLPSTSSTSVVAAVGPAASTPQGACHRRLPKHGNCRQNYSGDTYQGATVVNITTTSKAASRKSEGWSFGEKNLGPCGAKNPGIILPPQKLNPNQQTAARH
jgi:hypothetical protein